MQTSSGAITQVAVFPQDGAATETMIVEICLMKPTAVSYNTAFTLTVSTVVTIILLTS